MYQKKQKLKIFIYIIEIEGQYNNYYVFTFVWICKSQIKRYLPSKIKSLNYYFSHFAKQKRSPSQCFPNTLVNITKQYRSFYFVYLHDISFVSSLYICIEIPVFWTLKSLPWTISVPLIFTTFNILYRVQGIFSKPLPSKPMASST